MCFWLPSPSNNWFALDLLQIRHTFSNFIVSLDGEGDAILALTGRMLSFLGSLAVAAVVATPQGFALFGFCRWKPGHGKGKFFC